MGGGKGGGGPSYVPPPTTDNSAMMQAMIDQQAQMNKTMMDNFMQALNQDQTAITAPAIEPTTPPTTDNPDEFASILPVEEISQDIKDQTPEASTPVSSKPILDEEGPVTTMIKSLLTADEEDALA